MFSISHSCTGSAMLAKTQYECCDLGFFPVGELTHGKTRHWQRWNMPSGCTHPFYQPFGGDIRLVRNFLKTRNSRTGNSRRCLAGGYVMARKTLARCKIPSGADCRHVLLRECRSHRADCDDRRDCHADIHVTSTESLFDRARTHTRSWSPRLARRFVGSFTIIRRRTQFLSMDAKCQL
jgi:hypothetical protein